MLQFMGSQGVGHDYTTAISVRIQKLIEGNYYHIFFIYLTLSVTKFLLNICSAEYGHCSFNCLVNFFP